MQKSIFITGAAGGFGRACARLFASKGYYLGLFDVSEDGLSEMAEEYGAQRCCTQRLDVTDAEDCRQAIAYFGRHTGGRMHVLLNNAGIMGVGEFEQRELADELRIVDVNLKGPMNVAYHAYPLLRDTPGARLINLGSASALHGNPELVAYSLSKRAVNSFTESLDIGWAKDDIHVCDVNPMYARTNMMATNREFLRKLPERDIRLTAEDVAEAIYATLQDKRVHHYVGLDTKVYATAGKLLPFWLRRWVLRRVIGY
ncbi:short-subunit dehydrogenase [Neolewinella xylanilytica]|uniref:Short-subunit dehydrogenase n=1 Tax=Neolewinella xylanilytica TaxID=1514080 RepID=A0A2S6I506_9BACT|nr:SDR family oxidoreductase [Neolewinella xylanilytica]PPK86257.1 short-subunit dehydrogenase [Neolewinella xylanilytica]